jgi:FkbM family methyltransferase
MHIRRKIKQLIYGKFPTLAGSFPYYGTKVFFPKDSLIFKMACEQGIYEKNNLKVISTFIAPNSVYFDVGSNIGLMSIPILHNHPTCKVVSVEPSPTTLEFLRLTAKGSKFTNRWHIVGKATGNSIGSADFAMATADQGAFDGFQDTKRGGKTTKVSVPVTTIDSEWEEIDKPNVSFIKIDVEGSEIETLRGAVNCILQNQPCLLVEWNLLNLSAYNYSPNILLEFCRDINYDVIALPSLVPVLGSACLQLHMLTTENFLLAPKGKL